MTDAINIRYATGTRNMQVFSSRNASSRYLADGGGEGVKLEQQVLITDSGIEVLSEFPFEDALLA